jgi:serine/threonine protein kinase
MLMAIIGGWEQLGDPIGEGGQSNVYLVRRPARVAERNAALQGLLHDPWGPFSAAEMTGRLNVLLTSLSEYLRPDGPSDLGALKMFKIVGNGQQTEEAVGRLKNEITILQQDRSGLIKLLDASEEGRWIVTEFMPDGTIEKHPTTYKGNSLAALKAFRSLVETTAALHKGNYVHRDIKPANVFIKGNGLILGDLGIVFVPGQPDRLTVTDERVGPRDYMPQWADLGQRLENVHTNFDVYMLGKLLWCMVTGRLKLPREWYRRPPYDVTALFPNDPSMRIVNAILDKCVVEEPQDCLKSAQELLEIVDENLATLERGLPLVDLSGKLTFPCRVCGKGLYREHATVHLPAFDSMNRQTNPVYVRLFVCNVCAHYEMFAPNFPDEAAKRGWKPTI